MTDNNVFFAMRLVFEAGVGIGINLMVAVFSKNGWRFNKTF